MKNLSLTAIAVAAALSTSSAIEAKAAKIIYTDSNSAAQKQVQDPFEFLKANKVNLDIRGELSDLQLVRARESLTATHYHYKQTLHGIDVDLGEVIVSVASNGQIERVFNNTYLPVEQSSNKSNIGADKALNISWDYLQVTGSLSSKPMNKLVYAEIDGQLELVYKTQIGVDAPRGAWLQYVSAKTGEVLLATRIDKPNKANANEGAINGHWERFAVNKKAVSLMDALAKYELAKPKVANKSMLKATGSALVFDPNPVMTLRNDTLEDTTAASTFDPAYETKTLMDITLDGSTYRLNGPWVNIQNFENPATAPSTTTDGNWTAKRGDNAFNDGNTYYHLDANQRYMQSLGFTGSKGIQEVSINVDTDGWDGADNSSFSPAANQLSFGHGCVDDNEDADVILHEYGHAINYSINNNWTGGDTGGMGEGFGDYWAGSYRQSTPNGDFHPEWVFSWDGHNNCWGGRVMNRTNYTYDSTKSYGAHQNVNGELSDELWSTPLFQSLLELVNQGRTRDEVDTIILEAQFGLGANLKMPDMANAIVAAAENLYPDGPHATVFKEKFEQVKILGSSTTTPPPTTPPTTGGNDGGGGGSTGLGLLALLALALGRRRI